MREIGQIRPPEEDREVSQEHRLKLVSLIFFNPCQRLDIVVLPLLVSLIDTVLGVREQVEIEEEKDDENCLESKSHQVNHKRTACSDERDLIEAIFFPIVVNFTICYHVSVAFRDQEHDLEFVKLERAHALLEFLL